MVVCPQCGKPHSEEYYVEGARDLTCAYCGFSGSSTEFVVAERARDPQVFDFFYDTLLEQQGLALGRLLQEKGVIPAEAMKSPEALIPFLRKVLRTYVAAITEGVLDPNVLEDQDSLMTPHGIHVGFLYSFAPISQEVAKLLVQLEIVKKDMDPRNLRYLTRLLQFAFRKMWIYIMEKNQPQEEQEELGGEES